MKILVPVLFFTYQEVLNELPYFGFPVITP